MKTTALQQLGRFVAESAITPSVASKVFIRDALIDIYGCMLAGARQPVAIKTRQALLKTGQIDDRAAARIYGSNHRATPTAAAMLNAVAGHSLDFDDWEVPGNTHVSVVLFPAILAASAGRELSGAQAIDAYAAGFEVIARIGEAINLEHYASGWHATATLGAIGAAAAAARIMRLGSEQSTHALAIACSRALGFNAQFGSEAKPLQVGFAVEGGLLAAFLAAENLAGQAHVLDHASGLIALMGHDQPERILQPMSKLGKQLAIDEYGIVFKPWPCCGYTHRIMSGMLKLRSLPIDLARIEHIELHLPEMHAGILPFMQPRNRSEALFSLPFCASMALLYGTLTIQDIEEEAWQRDVVRQLIAKISLHPFRAARPELNYDPRQPDRIVVASSAIIEPVEIAYPIGSPQAPMSQQQHFSKFCFNSEFSEDRARPIWQALLDWQDCDNIHELLPA